MALVLKRTYKFVHFLEELRDPRTNGDPYTSPLSYFAMIGLYLYFFKKLGPKWMTNKKPINVKNAMIIYNILQILFNGYLFIKVCMLVTQLKNPFCEEVDYGSSSVGMLSLHYTRIYTYLKIFDIGDTIFFLLRKSFRQISFLHLYHHAGMLTLTWIGYRYLAGGTYLWIGVINTFVHFVMFIYYLLTSIDSSWKESYVFKRSLTQLQLIQFVVFICIFGNLAVSPTCAPTHPKYVSVLFTTQNFFMMFLFDPRTHGDPYLASPLCYFAVVGFYAYFFAKLGPKWMEKREAINVKSFMIVYNVLQILINSYLVYHGIQSLLQMQNPSCEIPDYSNSSTGMYCLYLCRIYTYLKLFDAGDTLFFLLRKSFRQITFLHLYHHCGMMTLVWIGLRYYAGGSFMWIGTINSFVHCVMFFYYLLTAIDSTWKHNLLLKRSLTQLQLTQFVAFVFIFGRITVSSSCNHLPKFLTLVFTVQNFFMIYLFGDFYYKTYINKPKAA